MTNTNRLKVVTEHAFKFKVISGLLKARIREKRKLHKVVKNPGLWVRYLSFGLVSGDSVSFS